MATRRTAQPARLSRLLPSVDWVNLRRGAAIAMWLGAFAAIVAVWIMAPAALRSAAALPERRDPGALERASFSFVPLEPAPIMAIFRDPPEWVPDHVLLALEALVGEHIGPDPLAREDLIAAREALERTGWFESVHQVRRTGRRAIEVVARFSVPVAVVRYRDRDHLVDAEGRLLPMSWPHGDAPSFGTIVGVASAPPRTPGSAWEGADLAAALATLALLDRQPWARQVALVDLGAHRSSGRIRLLTDRGTSILWGRAPGEERSAEVSARTKIEYLDHHHRRFGHIDGGLAGEIDIAGDVAMMRLRDGATTRR
ncbi:MAG TPA: hypothetical protein PKC43_06970 [Phycisphaerales bacterium]|nr:hypothetical protein [Phycisphaerales bacterium]HMP37175.1 hypothetical protein [Phycisphaerales bacterium]